MVLMMSILFWGDIFSENAAAFSDLFDVFGCWVSL